MSNTKWLKLFRAVIDSGVVIKHAQWHFIDSDHYSEISFPCERDLEATRFADGKFQPVGYRWIEAVYIPKAFKPIPGVGYEVKQDTAALITALEKAGKFPVQEAGDGVTIIGYRR